MTTSVPTLLQGFVREAKEILGDPISTLKLEPARPGPRPWSVSSAISAYEAALRMRGGNQKWLEVYDEADPTHTLGWLSRAGLEDVFKLIDAAPYLGEEMMEAIVPKFDRAALDLLQPAE